MTAYDTALHDFRAGQFVSVVRAAKNASPSTLSQEHRLLLAHACLYTGDVEYAVQLAQRENTAKSSPALRSRCELIIGLATKRRGHVIDAVARLKAAAGLAREAKDDRQLAWSSLHLFRILAEAQPSEATVPLLRELRPLVTRVADPHVSAYLHECIALMQAVRGELDEARRHLRISQSLIERHPNHWLSQLCSIGEFFLNFAECRYSAALTHIQAARELIPIVGGAQTSLIDSNEGHALLAVGAYADAIKRFNEVSSSRSLLPRLAAIDGLARAYLATNQLSECENALATLETLARAHDSVSDSFAVRWAIVTRLKLEMRTGQHEQAAKRAEFMLPDARRLGDQFLVATLLCLKGEALARSNRSTDAAAALLAASLAEAEPEEGHLASFCRSASVALRSGHRDVSESFFGRAVAIWKHQGNMAALGEARETAEAAENTALTCPLDVVAPVTAALANSLLLGHSPRLLGRELVDAATRLRCTPRAEMVVWNQEHQKAHRSDRNRVVDLGEEGGKKIALVCDVPQEPLHAIVLGDILRIGKAAIELERFRQEERNRAALWPADSVETEAGALILAEEMQNLLAIIRRVAPTTVPILITGETGTGKEVLARLIHAYSSRARAAFLPFNCSSSSKDMLDSQLFGHRRGAFTGAVDAFPGVIRSAASGTLFLDEIGETTLDVQPKLLRFLESGEVHPVGEAQPVRVDVRVIAATNADLDALVAQGRFREDLFYRLDIVRLRVPPLRERRVEIPALANHYLEKHAREYGKGALRLSEETIEYLVLYRWPGNVRQLANEMRRLAALAEAGAVLMPEHLSRDIAASRRTIPASERTLDSNEVVVRLDQPVPAATEHLERAMIQYALKQCGGRLEETAALLGLSRKGLYLKRQRYAIDSPTDSQGTDEAEPSPTPIELEGV